jgi:CRISPR type IV-associated protein Csf3
MASMLCESERTVMRSASGVYKCYQLPLRLVDCDRVVWFAVIRDKRSRMRHELKPVRFIGKKTSQGLGEVYRWEVEEADADHSWWSNGVLMRPLPASVDRPENARGFRESFGGVCAPYWQREFWKEMIVPC